MIRSAMAKPGPKPKPPEEVRSAVVSIKTTPPSKASWVMAADATGKSVNDWAIGILDEAAKKIISKRR